MGKLFRQVSVKKSSIFWVVFLFLVIALFGNGALYKLWKKEKHNRQRWQTNYHNETGRLKKYVDQFGDSVVFYKQYMFTTRELRRANQSLGHDLKKYREIARARGVKINNLRKIIETGIEATGEGSVGVTIGEQEVQADPEDVYQDHEFSAIIDDGYLWQSIDYKDETLSYYYLYGDTLYQDIDLIRKPNDRGEQYPWIIRWWRPWVPVTRGSTSNPNSEIVIANEIDIKRKGFLRVFKNIFDKKLDR